MTRKLRKTSRNTFRMSLFLLLTTFVVTLAVAGSSMSQSQQAPTLRIVSEDGNRFPVIVITGEDIRNLPAGETRIIQKVEGGDTGGAQTQAGGGVWKTSNGGKTWSLVKTGAGTLTFPPANQSEGMKFKEGKLVLTIGNHVIYEFRDLSAAEFDRVYVEENISLNFEEIKLFVQERRPPGEMNGWPFKRLLIARAASKKDETSTGKVKTYNNPQGKYVCKSGFCGCSGSNDCQTLADAGACASSINCDGAGSNLNCYCKAR